MDALELLIGSVPVAVLVFLTVQAAKVFGFTDSATAPQWAVGSALVFGAAAAAARLAPAAAPYVELFVSVLAGALVAGLGYEYIARPLLERFGLSASSEDLG